MTKLEFTTNLLSFQDELRRFAYKLTADHDDADDLLQETFLKVLDNQDKFLNDINFKAWIYTIMRNLFINEYRKYMRNQTFVDRTEGGYHLNAYQESGIDSPEHNYSVKEISKKLEATNDEYVTLFKMHIDGYRYEEIAVKKSLPIGTVKSRIFFARKRLQEELKDYRL